MSKTAKTAKTAKTDTTDTSNDFVKTIGHFCEGRRYHTVMYLYKHKFGYTGEIDKHLTMVVGKQTQPNLSNTLGYLQRNNVIEEIEKEPGRAKKRYTLQPHIIELLDFIQTYTGKIPPYEKVKRIKPVKKVVMPR